MNENRWYRIAVNARGEITSIYDKDLKRELLEGTANRLLYTRDGYRTWSDPETLGGTVTQKVWLDPDEKRIVIENVIADAADLWNTNRFYRYGHYAFPFKVERPRFYSQLNGPVVDAHAGVTPHVQDTYSCIRDWCAVENDTFGIALVQPDTCIVEYGELHATNAYCRMGRPSSGHVYPHAFADGLQYQHDRPPSFRFRFVLTSYAGSWRDAHIPAFAARQVGALAADREIAALVRADRPNVELTALKRAEDGNGLIVRFRETEGRMTAAKVVQSLVKNARIKRVSVLEGPWTGAAAVGADAVLRPFETVTLRLTGDLPPLRTAKAVEPWTGLLIRPRAFRGGKDGPMYLLWGTDAADDFDHYEIVRDGKVLATATNEVDEGVLYRNARYEDKTAGRNPHVYEIRSVYKDGRKSSRVHENAALKVVEDESSVSFFRRGAAEPFATMGRPAPEALKMSVRLDGDAPFAFLDFTPAATTGRIERIDAPYLTLSRTELCDPWKMRALGTGGLTPIDGHHGSYMYLALAEPVTRRGVVTAWLTSVKGSGTVGTRYVEGSVGVFPRLDYGCMAKAGMPCETFVVGAFDDCRLGLEAYADAIARRFDIALPPQISGYCTWYADRHEWSGDEASTKEFAELAKKLELKKWGLSFYQIDDMWQDGELANGPAKNFTRVDAKGPYPNGMKVAADAIAAAGLRPGLWFMPFSGTDGGEWWADKRDLFVRGPDGRTPYRIPWAGHPLDMSNPKAVAYVKDVVRRLTHEWGFRYLKPDGIYTALAQQLTGGGDVVADDYGRQTFADPTFTGVEAYRAGVAAMREAAGKDVFILACGVGGGVLRVTGANYGLTDAARVGPDNGPWERRYMLGVKPTTLRYFYNGRVWYNDPDPVYLRATRPIGQSRLFASWTAVAGMLWNFSDWIGDLPEDRLEILRRTLAPNTCRNVRPLDLFESDLPRTWHLEKGGYHVFDFCNWETREKGVFRYDAAYAGLAPKKTYVGFDFWNKTFVGPFKGELVAEVPPVDVKVWAVREVAKRPVLVSTSRHVTSPAFEVTDEAWSGRTLSGVSTVVPGDAYELRIWAPKGFVCTSAVAGDLKGDIRQDGSCLRVTFVSQTDRLAWRLMFGE